MITLETKSPSYDSDTTRRRSLMFCLLGCETRPPYGPTAHTAQLFCDLLLTSAMYNHTSTTSSLSYAICIHAYNAKDCEYPTDWSIYDGTILPGSFSAAYDTDLPWILRLQEVIRTEIVAHERPTLGICFGHQILAHALVGGRAMQNPAGARAGRVPVHLSAHGRRWLVLEKEEEDSKEADDERSLLHLYVTHGDMVSQLPKCAVSLTTEVKDWPTSQDKQHLPYQALAYFGSGTATTTASTCTEPQQQEQKPFAFTFQAHPEYATTRSLGVEGTLVPCMDAQLARGAIDPTTYTTATQMARDAFPAVHEDSIRTIAAVGQQLGWFV